MLSYAENEAELGGGVVLKIDPLVPFKRIKVSALEVGGSAVE
jgi:hypothetical protein